MLGLKLNRVSKRGNDNDNENHLLTKLYSENSRFLLYVLTVLSGRLVIKSYIAHSYVLFQ